VLLLAGKGEAMPLVFLALVAAGACLIVCLNAETVGRRLGVMDHPDNSRKVHDRATPLIGGIAILLPLLIWLTGALLLDQVAQTKTLFVLILCASGVGLVGFADDQTPTTPLSRILSLLVFLGVAFVIDPTLIAHNLNWGSF
jgi:UDP-GlcNAc:undecaprenyl-phosphate GlcNAc-1-phosphate transferase